MKNFFDNEDEIIDDEESFKEINFNFLTNEQANSLTEYQFDEYVNSIFTYYREDYGFIFDNLYITNDYKNKRFVMLQRYNEYNCLDENFDIKPNTLCTVVADSYHKHKIDVESVGFKTPRQIYEDDILFKRLLVKSLKIFNGDATPNSLKGLFRIFSGVQVVSNFRPTAAKLIYKLFLPREGGKVWDMSAGWGGRLFASLASTTVKEYHATEPSTETVKGLNKIISDYDFNKKAKIFQQGSETYINENYYDLCFTSPPYFNTEKYANEDTQSFKLFTSKELWKNNFLRKTLQNCFVNLKNERYCIINIANVKTYKDLVEDTICVAMEEGFKYINQIQYLMSRLPGKGVDKKTIKSKGEPVLIFYKGEMFDETNYYKNFFSQNTSIDSFFN